MHKIYGAQSEVKNSSEMDGERSGRHIVKSVNA